MARIVLTYARADAEAPAHELHQRLNLAGHLVWRNFALDAPDLRDATRQAIETADAVLILITPAALSAPEVELEWRTAQALNKRLIGIQLIAASAPTGRHLDRFYPAATPDQRKALLPRLLNELQALESGALPYNSATAPNPALAVTQAGLDALRHAIDHYRQRITAAPPKPDAPYLGLIPFDTPDAPLFFGRYDELGRVAQLIERHPLAVLHARSGGGKTSFLRAGLIPRLLALGYFPIYARLRHHPDEAIKRALFPQRIPLELKNLPLAQFLQLAEQRLQRHERGFVILLDQFEEFFIAHTRHEDRQRVVDLLADCLATDKLRVRFLLSMRKDFFSDLGDFQERIPDIYQREYRLPPLNRAEAKDAILTPLEKYAPQVNFSHTLLDALLDDLEAAEMPLPQLQIVCRELYTHYAPMLTLTAYERIGRVRGSVGRYVTQALDALPTEERDLGRRLLLELVGRGRGMVARAKLAEALAITPEHADALIARLAAGRLLHIEAAEVELAHEYLIAEITRLFSTSGPSAAEMLDQSLAAYRSTGLLIARPLLERFHQERDKLPALTDAHLALLILSAAQESYEIRAWVQREPLRSLTAIESLLIDPQHMAARPRLIAALRFIGSPALPLLVTALADPDLRRYAERALASINTPEARAALHMPISAAAPVSALDDTLVIEPRRSTDEIPQIDASTYQLTARDLESSSSDRRKRAALRLGWEKNLSALPALLHMLRTDWDMAVREAAAIALGQIGDNHAIEGLIDACRDRNWSVRLEAINALVRLGDSRAIPAIRELLRDGYPSVRRAASEALLRLQPAGDGEGETEPADPPTKPIRWKHLNPQVIDILADGGPDAEYHIRRLTTLGSDVVAELRGLVKSTVQQDIRIIGLRILERIRTPLAAEAIVEALDDDSDVVRQQAVKALSKMRGDVVYAGLRKALTDDSPEVRWHAVKGLWEFPDALSQLVAALDDDSADVRFIARKGLERLGNRAVTALRTALETKTVTNRELIIEALQNIGTPAAREALADWK